MINKNNLEKHLQSLIAAYNNKRYKEAISLANEILILNLESDNKYFATTHFYLAKCYEKLEDHFNTQVHFKLATPYFELTRDLNQLFIIYNSLGICFSHYGDLKSSDSSFTKAYKVALDLNDIEKEMSAINNLATIGITTGNVSSAIDLHTLCHQRAMEMDNLFFAAMSLLNLSRCRLSKNDTNPKELLSDIDEAISIFQSLDENHNLANAKNVKAGILFSFGEYQQAKGLMEEVQKYYLSEKKLGSLLTSKIDYSRIIFELGNHKESISILLETLEQAEKQNFEEIKLGSIKALVHQYHQLNNFKEEAHYLRVLIDIKEKYADYKLQTQIENRTAEIEKLRVTFETEKKDRAIIELKKEIEYKKRELTTKILSIIHRNKLITNSLNSLKRIDVKDKVQRAEIQRTISLLEKELQQDDAWEEFEQWFTEVHSSFFDNLNKLCPKLSHRNRQLAAYLKLGLRSKQIATLMNVTVPSVEQYRIRLRKKLNLKSGENLFKLLNDL